MGRLHNAALPRAEAPGILGRGVSGRENPPAHGPHNALFAEQVQSNLHAPQMLRMDFPRSVQLRVIMDDGHDIERRDCIRRLFAVLTARLEDAATLAAEGQGREVSAEASTKLAAEIHEIAGHCVAITEAIELLSSEE